MLSCELLFLSYLILFFFIIGLQLVTFDVNYHAYFSAISTTTFKYSFHRGHFHFFRLISVELKSEKNSETKNLTKLVLERMGTAFVPN